MTRAEQKPTVSLWLNFDGGQGEYKWTCPLCGEERPAWPDEEGPFTQVICDDCDMWFDAWKED